MNKIISKSIIEGELKAPTSKSALQRLIAAAMLADGESVIHYESICEDALAVLDIASKICTNVIHDKKQIRIKGGFINPSEKLNVGESGLGLRMLAPILASTGYPFEISGKGSLLKRPHGFVCESLKASGVSVDSNNNSLPFKIKGPISADKIFIDGSVGSQLLTGYLMAAPLLNRDFEIAVDDLKSKPYIDLTISVLKEFGIEVQHQNYQKFFMRKGQKYMPKIIQAEGDWSGAAFPLVAAAIAGKIVLKGLTTTSTQGDKAILKVLEKCGAIVKADSEGISVSSHSLKPFEYDATDTPDLFPPLVALAVNCKGHSIIKGVSRLKDKESNRGITLMGEFLKLGAHISINDDLMLVDGCLLKGNTVHAHDDHRIAMSLATGALDAEGKVIIENAEAVGKSWPDFFEEMRKVGVKIE